MMQSLKSFFTHRTLVASFVFIFLLIISWYIPFFHNVWIKIDKSIYLSLNHSIQNHEKIQYFIAWLNSRYGDWLFEAFIIGTYLISLFFTDKSKKQRLLELVTLLLFILFIQIAVNYLVCRKILHLSRFSPSKVIPCFTDLSFFKFPHNRVSSFHSFPSDTGTTLFICSIFSWMHFQWKTAIFITIVSVLFAMPRLFAGAHWFSDILFGSFCIALGVIAVFKAFGFFDKMKSYSKAHSGY